VERQAKDEDVEVNGVTGEVALWPVFDAETGKGRQSRIARLAGEDSESVLLQQRHRRGQPSGTD
jgi:hypothetical protein